MGDMELCDHINSLFHIIELRLLARNRAMELLMVIISAAGQLIPHPKCNSTTTNSRDPVYANLELN